MEKKTSESEDIALRLERVLGIDSRFWRNFYRQYQAFLAETVEKTSD